MKSKSKAMPVSELEALESLAFDYYDRLSSIVRDLEFIDKAIPIESARHGCLMDSVRQAEEMAIIEARKSELLRYIQVICRDHIIWSKKILDRGWTADRAAGRKSSKRP